MQLDNRDTVQLGDGTVVRVGGNVLWDEPYGEYHMVCGAYLKGGDDDNRRLSLYYCLYRGITLVVLQGDVDIIADGWPEKWVDQLMETYKDRARFDCLALINGYPEQLETLYQEKLRAKSRIVTSAIVGANGHGGVLLP